MQIPSPWTTWNRPAQAAAAQPQPSYPPPHAPSPDIPIPSDPLLQTLANHHDRLAAIEMHWPPLVQTVNDHSMAISQAPSAQDVAALALKVKQLESLVMVLTCGLVGAGCLMVLTIGMLGSAAPVQTAPPQQGVTNGTAFS